MMQYDENNVKSSHIQVTVKWTAATLQYAYDINFDRFISSVTRRRSSYHQQSV